MSDGKKYRSEKEDILKNMQQIDYRDVSKLISLGPCQHMSPYDPNRVLTGPFTLVTNYIKQRKEAAPDFIK
jgi:hypothetical protein